MQRICTHKDSIALRGVVTYDGWIFSQDCLALLLPILGIISKCKHLILKIIHLDIIQRHHMAIGTIIRQGIAPDLLLLREDISVTSDHIEIPLFIIMALICREVIAITVPDLTIGKESRKLGICIIDYRVALHIILITMQFYILDTYNIMILSIIISSLRLDDIVIMHQYTTIAIATHLILSIEAKIIGIEQCIAIYHLHNRSIDLGISCTTIIYGTIAIHIYRILIYDYPTEETPMGIIISHRTIAPDNCSIVVCCKISNKADNTISLAMVWADKICHKVNLTLSLLSIRYRLFLLLRKIKSRLTHQVRDMTSAYPLSIEDPDKG